MREAGDLTTLLVPDFSATVHRTRSQPTVAGAKDDAHYPALVSLKPLKEPALEVPDLHLIVRAPGGQVLSVRTETDVQQHRLGGMGKPSGTPRISPFGDVPQADSAVGGGSGK